MYKKTTNTTYYFNVNCVTFFLQLSYSASKNQKRFNLNFSLTMCEKNLIVSCISLNKLHFSDVDCDVV